MARPHVVYHLYDASGRLLYVGCTTSFSGRMNSHSKRPWGGQVYRADLRFFHSAADAVAFEVASIASGRPKHNIEYNRPERRQPPGTRMRQVLAVLQDGPLTQREIERHCGNTNTTRSNAWVGTILNRLLAKGDIEIVESRSAIAGPRPSARVYGLPDPRSQAVAS